MFSPILKTPPTATPVSKDETKAHLRVEHADDDSLITSLIEAATGHLDGHVGILGKCLVNQTWTREYTGFNSCMRLPLTPVSAVSTITYTDSTGGAQTLLNTEYELLSDEIGPYVSINTIPSADDGRVKIEFIAGYGDESKVPAPIKAAILLHVGSLYELREQDVIGVSLTKSDTYKSLIAPYRRWNI